MNKHFSLGLAFSLLAAWSAPAAAQVPPVVAPGPTVAPAPTAAATQATQFNIFEMFNCTKLKKECKDCLCASPLGQMLNNMTGMAGTFTGGLIPPLCPPKTAEDLLKAAADPNKSSAEKIADEIKASEAQAKARAAAMRFLGTVDCERFGQAGFPVALELIKGLSDTSECVRLAAAEALSNGCCCNEDTIEALAAVAAGAALFKKDEKTGLRTPAAGIQILPEKCPRVRAAARFGLERCLCCYVKKEPYVKRPGSERREGEPPLPRREGVPAANATKGAVQQARFEDQAQQPQRREGLGMPSEKVVQKAEQVLQGCGTIETPGVPANDCSLFGLCNRAYHKQYKRQVIRTTILDTSKDCEGKDVPVGADPNAVIKPKSQLKENLRNMCSPVVRAHGQEGDTTSGMTTGPTTQGAPSSSGQQPGSTQPGSTGTQPIIIYEAPAKQVVAPSNVSVIVQPVRQPVNVPVTHAPVYQTSATLVPAKKTSSFNLPFLNRKTAVKENVPTVVETISTPMPVSERRVVPVTVSPVSQPLPLPPQERRVVSYQLQPPQ